MHNIFSKISVKKLSSVHPNNSDAEILELTLLFIPCYKKEDVLLC